MHSITIKAPGTSEEFEAYYNLRYEVLRKPWKHPKGSERDDDDETSIHAMALDPQNSTWGVGRLHFNTPQEAQIRFMGVKAEAQGSGIGRSLLQHLEKIAKEKGAEIIVLHARENALEFYRRCGYTVKEKSYLLWGEIQHFLMTKML